MKEIKFKKLKNKIEKFKLSLTEKDILDLLKIEKRWPLKYPWGQGSVEIISEVNSYGPVDFFKARHTHAFLDYEKWFSYYEKGFTTIISNVFDLTEELRNLSVLIKNEIGLDCNANFYFSRPGKKESFDLHSHEYPVIVKQIYGDVDWQIEDKKFKLTPQKTCLIPINAKHAVISKNNNKLSLTINIH